MANFKIITATIAILTGLYCAYALYWMSFNPALWSEPGRGSCAIIMFAGLFVGVLTSINDEL